MNLLQKITQMGEGELGRVGEKLVEKCLMASDVPYVPLQSIQRGGAPMVVQGNPVVLPDYQLYLDGKAAGLDVKCKKRSVLFHKYNEERHGIDRDKFLHYKAYGDLARANAGLIVVEMFRVDLTKWSGTILLGTFLRILEPCEAIGDAKGEWVYWPRRKFTPLWTFSPEEMWAVLGGKKVSSRRDVISAELSLPDTRQRMLPF